MFSSVQAVRSRPSMICCRMRTVPPCLGFPCFLSKGQLLPSLRNMNDLICSPHINPSSRYSSMSQFCSLFSSPDLNPNPPQLSFSFPMPTNTLNNIPWPRFSLKLWPQFPTNFTPWAVPGTLSTATPSHGVLILKILWIRSPLLILKPFLQSPSDTSDKLKGILKWHEGTFDSSILDTKCSVVYICRDLGWEELAGQRADDVNI